jgi:hypothetical protein
MGWYPVLIPTKAADNPPSNISIISFGLVLLNIAVAKNPFISLQHKI